MGGEGPPPCWNPSRGPIAAPSVYGSPTFGLACGNRNARTRTHVIEGGRWVAGFGPPPKGNKRRRNADTFATPNPGTVLTEGASAPELPTPKRWLKQTRDWWKTWADSSQAAHFTDTDWQRLLALLPLMDSYQRLTVFENATDTRKMRAALEILKEIRQNESLLGATHVDRLRGRMTSAGPKQDDSGNGGEIVDLSVYSGLVQEA